MAESSDSLAELDPSIASRMEVGCIGQGLASGRAGEDSSFACNFGSVFWEDSMFDTKMLVLGYSPQKGALNSRGEHSRIRVSQPTGWQA